MESTSIAKIGQISASLKPLLSHLLPFAITQVGLNKWRLIAYSTERFIPSHHFRLLPAQAAIFYQHLSLRVTKACSWLIKRQFIFAVRMSPSQTHTLTLLVTGVLAIFHGVILIVNIIVNIDFLTLFFFIFLGKQNKAFTLCLWTPQCRTLPLTTQCEENRHI